MFGHVGITAPTWNEVLSRRWGGEDLESFMRRRAPPTGLAR
jgi:hypothetical protein